jgi:hypothetical protein
MAESEHARPWSRRALEEGGFRGFVPFAALTAADVPAAPGVYAVVRASDAAPTFSEGSPAGHFKGKDPALPVDALAEHWIDGPEVLYIGSATLGSTGKRGLRKRVDEYRRHGAGEPVGHWGGRSIWQLGERDDLLVAWNATDEDPAVLKSRMLGHFVDRYGKLPFANLRR